MALFTWMLGRLYCKFKSCLNSANGTGKTARVGYVCGFDIIDNSFDDTYFSCFISWKEMNSCHFNEDQFGKVWSISLHFISSYDILLFSLCFRIYFFFSISFFQFLLLSLCLTSSPKFEISVSTIFEGFCSFHLEERPPHCPNMPPSIPFCLAPASAKFWFYFSA